jgi:hypothetical protein
MAFAWVSLYQTIKVVIAITAGSFWPFFQFTGRDGAMPGTGAVDRRCGNDEPDGGCHRLVVGRI